MIYLYILQPLAFPKRDINLAAGDTLKTNGCQTVECENNNMQPSFSIYNIDFFSNQNLN